MNRTHTHIHTHTHTHTHTHSCTHIEKWRVNSFRSAPVEPDQTVVCHTEHAPHRGWEGQHEVGVLVNIVHGPHPRGEVLVLEVESEGFEGPTIASLGGEGSGRGGEGSGRRGEGEWEGEWEAG